MLSKKSYKQTMQ